MQAMPLLLWNHEDSRGDGSRRAEVHGFAAWNRARGVLRRDAHVKRAGMISQGGGGGAGHRQAALRKDIAEQVHEQIFDSSWQPKEDEAKMQALLHGVRILRAPTASELVKGGPWDAIMVGAGLSGAILAERYGGRMRTRTCACICVWERARAHACETETHRETQSQTLTQTQPQTEIQTQTQEAETDAEIETLADRQSERRECLCMCVHSRCAFDF